MASLSVQASLAAMAKQVAARNARGVALQARVTAMDAQKASTKSSYEKYIDTMNRERSAQRATSAANKSYGQAFAANKARQARIEAMYDQMLKATSREGAFYKSSVGQIEQAKVKGVGQETQNLISSGMYGTTTAAGTPRRWEADVGQPARLKLEDLMEQRRMGIQQQRAGFVERIEDSYPDYSSMFSMLAR